MKIILHLISLLLFTVGQATLNRQTIQRIGEQIWANESGKSMDKLTHWNEGEEFPSLGIGHFIWYAQGHEQRFEETFPQLVLFLKQKGVQMPAWTNGHCPWSCRKAFYDDFKGPQLTQLREILYSTRDYQVDFMVARMENGLKHFAVSTVLNKLKADPQGVYALVDYVNFKGLGVNPSERYQGQGWGLLQVLEGIPANSKNVVADFVSSAKKVLAERVRHSPPERKEARWLPGWNNRLETYLKF